MQRLHIIFFFVLFSTAAQAGPIYVFKEKDGSIRFSSKPPPDGVTAKVFTAREGSFSWYKIGTPGSQRRNFWTLEPNKYSEIINAASLKTGVDNSLIRAVIHVESGFNHRAISPKGARGLMQLIPGTAKLVGVKNVFDPEDNIMGGAKYLKYLLSEFNGNTAYAVAGYNAGPGNVKQYKGIPPFSETRAYVKAVLTLKDRYKGDVVKKR